MSDLTEMRTGTSIWNGVFNYLKQSYMEQAADEGIEWTEQHNEWVEVEAEGIYGQVSQAVEMYMNHLASPLPNFSEDEDE